MADRSASMADDAEDVTMRADKLSEKRLKQDAENNTFTNSLGRIWRGGRDDYAKGTPEQEAQRKRVDANRAADFAERTSNPSCVEYGGHCGSSTRNDDGSPKITF